MSVRLDAFADHIELFFDPLGDGTEPELIHPAGGATQVAAKWGLSVNGTSADANDHRWVLASPASGTPAGLTSALELAVSASESQSMTPSAKSQKS